MVILRPAAKIIKIRATALTIALIIIELDVIC